MDYLDGVYLNAFKSKIFPRIAPGVATSGAFLNRTIYWFPEGFALEPDRKQGRTSSRCIRVWIRLSHETPLGEKMLAVVLQPRTIA